MTPAEPSTTDTALKLFEMDTFDERACDAYNLEHAQAAIAVFRGARPADFPPAAVAYAVHPDQDPRAQARGLAARFAPRGQPIVLAVCGQLPEPERGSALAQAEKAEWAWKFLYELKRRTALSGVLCAGRPGWEIGFAAAALSLDLRGEATMPKHFCQRGISRASVPRLPWQLQAEVAHWARLLWLLEGS